MMRRLFVVPGLLLLVSCVSSRIQPADLVLTSGHVFTGDQSQPWAEGVAIRGDRIVAVRSDAVVRGYAGPSTRVLDLGGKTVVPGFNDAHVHAPWPREKTADVEVPREGVTKESLLAAVRSAVANAEGSLPIAGELPLELVDAGITRDDLDAISATRPIRLGVFGGHSAILNTAALRAWGIAEDAQDPAGGAYGRKDGKLNGWLYEHAYWRPQLAFAATVSDDEIGKTGTAFEDEMLSYGVTSVQTMPTLTPERAEAVIAAASPRLRWRVMDFRMAPYDGSVKRYPVKYVLDGTPIERSAATTIPYADDASSRGMLNYSVEEIDAMVRDAALGRRQLLVHAVGDRAIDALFAAMERTPANWPALRVRVEHGDLMSELLAERARKLGVVVVQNPAHFMIPHVMGPRYGELAGHTQRAHYLVEAGNRFALGSDGPLNPFLNIFFATLHPTNPAEHLTVEEAVRAYTTGSAFAEFKENEKGRIAPGMLADLAVLSHDIFSMAPDQLPATKSVLTVVGGKIVWEASAPAAGSHGRP